MSTIKYINLCIKKDELVDYLYKLYDAKYNELLKNHNTLIEMHKTSKFRLILYSALTAFNMYSYLRQPTTLMFWWETCMIILLCMSYRMYKKSKYIPSIPESLVPTEESWEELTYEEVLDTDLVLDEESPFCCARALCLHSVDTLKLLKGGRVLVLLSSGMYTFIKPVLVREGDIDAITINNSGAYFGNQCNVATSAIVKTLKVNINFDRE